ncbi:MAG: hypothetical protein IBX68_03675 [Dehalococcoidia bacterium]|nr:hypothetical protein [Dehalococcoidia bacterium]
MIWFRRVLIIPLSIILLLVLSSVLLVTQVNDTLGNPRFYNDQMSRNDMYAFIHEGVLPAALDDFETNGYAEDMPVRITAIGDDLIAAAGKILPARWLQDSFESGTEAVIPYLTGSRDSFTYTLVLKDRVETASAVVKSDILGADAFGILYQDLVDYITRNMHEEFQDLPAELTLTLAEIEESMERIAPADWLVDRLEVLLDSITPYLTGETDFFAFETGLEGRVDAIASVVIDLLCRPETYDYFLEQVLVPEIMQELESTICLPYGVAVSAEEVECAVRTVLPLSWMRETLAEIVGSLANYIKGESASLGAVIDLSDEKEAIKNSVAALANEKMADLLCSLPVCTMAQFLQIVSALPPYTLPGCRPLELSCDELRAYLEIEFGAYVEQAIIDDIPDKIALDGEDIRLLLGDSAIDFVDRARELVADYSTVDENDLAQLLGRDGMEELQDMRSTIAQGYTVTDSDLREIIGVEEDQAAFDDARRWIGTTRSWLWAFWLIPFAGLVPIGLLGGRTWRTRLIWAFAALFFAALIVYIAVAVSYPVLLEPRIEELSLEASGDSHIEAALVLKGNALMESAATTFTSGLKNKILMLMAGSGAVLVGAGLWPLIRKRIGEDQLDSGSSGSSGSSSDG